MLVMLMTCSQKLNYSCICIDLQMKSAIAELWCSPATTVCNYLSDNTTNINDVDENASIFNMMSMKNMIFYI